MYVKYIYIYIYIYMLCMCMYVCIYIYIYVHTYMYMYAHIWLLAEPLFLVLRRSAVCASPGLEFRMPPPGES